MEALLGLLLFFGFFAVLLGILCAAIAEKKGRSGIGWFFLGALFPVIGLIAVLIVGPDHVELKKRKMVSKGVKSCRYCLSVINKLATRCPKCAGDLTVEEVEEEPQQEESEERKSLQFY